MIVGQDVSEFQGQIDWNIYKNNSNFVIIRATYGNGYVDKQFFRNRDEARRVNLPRGFYHYCYPQYNTPEAEADWFLSQINPQEGESLYLDYEESWNGDKVTWCKAFLDRIASHLNGYKALIYLNQSLATSNDWTPIVEAGYGLWIAAYTYDPNNNNFQIGNWQFAALQQWTDKQMVPGIIGNVDGDVFFGDVSSFQKYGYHAPILSPPPSPPAPPSSPGTPSGGDYKSYLVNIKGVLYGTKPWWSNFLKDKRLTDITKEIEKSGV